MNWKRIAPWNWFKDEAAASVAREERGDSAPDAMAGLLGELERMLGVVRQLPGGTGLARMPGAPPGFLRPNVDIVEGKKTYTVKADLPGVELDDLTIEVDGHTLAIRGEKHQEREADDQGYHCIERSYGAVQRVLSLPDDADVEAIDAKFKNGVLELRIPKHSAPASSARSIEITLG
jgi:HSP20 family protein